MSDLAGLNALLWALTVALSLFVAAVLIHVAFRVYEEHLDSKWRRQNERDAAWWRRDKQMYARVVKERLETGTNEIEGARRVFREFMECAEDQD